MKTSNPIFQLARGAAALALVLIIGTIGYSIIQGWSLWDSFYMTVITISTVGFGEIHPMSIGGQIFTVVLIFIGVGTLLYLFSSGVQYLLEGELGLRLGRRRMNERIRKLHNHFIVCGYGRVGEAVASVLKQQNIDFVAVDLREDCFNRALAANHMAIRGDATATEILNQVSIEHARGLIVCFGNDADNLYAILSAKEINPKIEIISRANSKEAANRMRVAGAEHVIAPEVIGGQQMAMLALRPAAVQFVETILSSKKEDLIVEDIKASADSSLIGSTIGQIEDRFTRVKILAIRVEDGPAVINPPLDTVIQANHILTVFGPLEQMQNLEGCCQL
jgi:voltage-gated potassium channel